MLYLPYLRVSASGDNRRKGVSALDLNWRCSQTNVSEMQDGEKDEVVDVHTSDRGCVREREVSAPAMRDRQCAGREKLTAVRTLERAHRL